MYPTAHYEIAKARVADFHQDAKRDAMARAVGQAPKHQSKRRPLRIPAAARRVFTVLAARA